jgi:hypothetical protein
MDPLAPGKETSEWTLAKVAVVIGIVLQASAGTLYELQGAGINAPWFPIALAGIGTILQVLTFAGYNKGRALVKVAAIEAGLVPSSSMPTPPARPAVMPVITPAPLQPPNPSTPPAG